MLPATEQDRTSWLERLLKSPLPGFPATLARLPEAVATTCAVAALVPVEELDAAAFEANAGEAATVDLSGLTQAAASALARLQHMVAAIGGRIKLESAYRSPAYQDHLQAVWDKWRLLRGNRQKGCQELRAEVGAEFARHRLMERQRPVSDSDHTRGIGFDASFFLPAGARWNRRRISLDRLAQMAGFRRPDIRHDPVHFRYLASDERPLPTQPVVYKTRRGRHRMSALGRL